MVEEEIKEGTTNMGMRRRASSARAPRGACSAARLPTGEGSPGGGARLSSRQTRTSGEAA